MKEQRFDNCPVAIAYAKHAYFFGNVAKHLRTDGLKEMRCVVNYWLFVLLYVFLCIVGIGIALALSNAASSAIGQEWSVGYLFFLISGAFIAAAIRITDTLTVKFSSMQVRFEEKKIVVSGNTYDLVEEIYDVRKTPFSSRKVVIYGLRAQDGVAKPFLFRMTFQREAHAHFFVRYVEYLHAKAAAEAIKKSSEEKEAEG